MFAYQKDSRPISGGSCNTVNFRVWLNVNGSFVHNSNVLLNLNCDTKDVIVTQGILELKKNDVLKIMMASNVANQVFIETIASGEFEPLVPSIILTVYKIKLFK